MSNEIEIFYDLGSPYSYLATTQVDRLREATGRPVRLRAFLLGGVFKAVGNEAPASVPAKAQWLFRDLEMWADRYGVPFVMSKHFAWNSLRPMRVLLGLERRDPAEAERLAHILYRKLWGEEADPNDMATYTSAVEEAGLSPDVLAFSEDPEIKQALKDVTAEAVERGAFGAPAIFCDGELYWGNDRLELLTWRLAR